jgi:ABC-type nitrate/sulfonate/bicarbonate transport system substrate-binding protein
MVRHLSIGLCFLCISLEFQCPVLAGAATKVVVAYASPSASFCPAWVAKLQNLFPKYGLDVELVLMQGASTYIPALLSGNIQILYGGGTSVSRGIARGDMDFVVIGSETRYVPLRLMVHPSIRKPADLKGKKVGVAPGDLAEYGILYYFDKIGLVPGKDVRIVYTHGGVTGRVAAMEQGLFDATVVNPPNEYQLETAGFRELVNFLDLKMPYAGVPYTVTRKFREENRKTLEDFMTAVIEGMQLFRTNKAIAYKAMVQLTRMNDPVLLERTYQSYIKQYEAIGGLPIPWQTGMESMINGFHARLTPAIVKNRDAGPFMDASFVEAAAARLGL